MHRRGIAAAIDAALADVDALVAKHVVVVGIDELVAEMHDVEHGADGAASVPRA